MDESALDSLIDTLAGPEEDVPTTPVYTGPEITVFYTSHSYFLEYPSLNYICSSSLLRWFRTCSCDLLRVKTECAQLHFDVGFVNIEMTEFWEFAEECITLSLNGRVT